MREIDNRNFFKGRVSAYNNIFTYTHENARVRFMDILKAKNISQVYTRYIVESDPISLELMFFSELTIAISPTNIIGTESDVNETDKTFTYNNQIFRTFDVLKPFKDENVQRIKHGDHIIGDYYKDRNLIVMYFNLFPNPPRIRKFQNAIDLLFSNIKGLDTVDNSKKIIAAQMKQNYSNFSKSLKTQHTKLKSEINQSVSDIDSYGTSIVNCEKKIQINNAAYIGIDTLLKNFDTEFEQRIEELKTLPFLNSVIVTNDGIKLDYGEISIKNGAKTYYIGHMVVILKYDKIRFNNLNNSSSGCPHPHVRNGGEACFGGYQKDANKLLGQLEFKKLAILLRQMLISYNPNSPIHEITHWTSKILSENAPKKVKKVKKSVASVREGVTANIAPIRSILREILVSENYKRGVGLSNEDFTRLNTSQRRLYMENRLNRPEEMEQ